MDAKAHIFWESHKILRNIHQLFDWQYIFVLNAHENIKNPPQKLGNNSQLKIVSLTHRLGFWRISRQISPLSGSRFGYLRVVLWSFPSKRVTGRWFFLIFDISEQIFSFWQMFVFVFPSWWNIAFKSSPLNSSNTHHHCEKLY